MPIWHNYYTYLIKVQVIIKSFKKHKILIYYHILYDLPSILRSDVAVVERRAGCEVLIGYQTALHAQRRYALSWNKRQKTVIFIHLKYNNRQIKNRIFVF